MWLDDISNKLPHSDDPPMWWIVIEWIKTIALATAVTGGLVALAVYPSKATDRAVMVTGFALLTVIVATIFLSPDWIRAMLTSIRVTSSKEANRAFAEALQVDRSSPIWLPRRVQGFVMLGWAATVLALMARVAVHIW